MATRITPAEYVAALRSEIRQSDDEAWRIRSTFRPWACGALVTAIALFVTGVDFLGAVAFGLLLYGAHVCILGAVFERSHRAASRDRLAAEFSRLSPAERAEVLARLRCAREGPTRAAAIRLIRSLGVSNEPSPATLADGSGNEPAA